MLLFNLHTQILPPVTKHAKPRSAFAQHLAAEAQTPSLWLASNIWFGIDGKFDSYTHSMNFALECTLYIAAAIALIAVVVWVTRLKVRGATKFMLNALSGAALIAGLSASGVLILPLNLFNAVLTGVLGLPGACVVVAAAFLL